MSVITTDKRSYFLKVTAIDPTDFTGSNMRLQKVTLPFQEIEEVIQEAES